MNDKHEKHLRLWPLTIKQANKMVGDWHRHHGTVPGMRWAQGIVEKETKRLVGAVIVGRPVARMTDQYMVAEATRCVTDGYRNGCSKLYGACARAAQNHGFDEIQTFILKSESGVSLRAAGWIEDTDHISRGGSWNRPSRGGRREDQPQEEKRRFYRLLPQ